MRRKKFERRVAPTSVGRFHRESLHEVRHAFMNPQPGRVQGSMSQLMSE